MFRLQVESLSIEWRSFRWTTYLLLAGIAPMAVAGGVTLGSPFGTGFILPVLPLLYGISAFGVEFTIHTAKRPQVTEFSADGIRFYGPNITPLSFPWKDLTRIHVRSMGSRQAPALLVFVFRKGLLNRLVPVDFGKDSTVAEWVAAFVTRYAPNLRRTGNIEVLRWEPSRALDGDATTRPRRFQSDYFGVIAILGPLMNLFFAYVTLAYGLVQDPVIGWPMIGAYLLLGATLIVYSWRCARRSWPLVPPLHRQTILTTLFMAGVVLVLLQGLLAILFLL